MRVLIVHPLMSAMGGGERLCCETMRALIGRGDKPTLLSGEFKIDRLERFFGYEGLFKDISVKSYAADSGDRFGTYKHLLHHVKAQRKIISADPNYDLVFSTQDAGYIPDISRPIFQWGYFPNALTGGIYGWPLRVHYSRKIRRINLVLAISEYSKSHFDQEWKIPTVLVYPACNMIQPSQVRDNVVVTVARGVPEKNLELFWEVAKRFPSHEFVLLLTRDPRFVEYSMALECTAPANGRVIVNPDKEMYQETLSRSKIYLHLMRGEHFGITVVESMSAGCVPVVHDSGGPKEIVGSSGLLWHREDEIPILLAIADASYEAMSKLSMERAKAFSREKFDKSFGEVLARTVSRVP
ncbi:glycosyltransferase [Candidatus Bathyarchaeota archaeon]|nr:MAG: glycosyltransferase [Candidatus Bathyarchaeota archaeon]TMI58950.1 MAG: glycosyltransferase [Candidatus Bathyarchaeota archaeon]